MANMSTLELKAFLPSKDLEVSKGFYRDLGFAVAMLSEDLACFESGSAKFLMQQYYVKDFAENLMMHLLVEKVDDWWIRAKAAVPKYNDSLSDVIAQPWGIRDFTFLDPAGVLWRVGEEI